MFRSIISCVFGIVFIASVCYLKYTPKIIIYWTNTSFIACLYIIPIAMFMIDTLKKIKFRPLEILGRSSYHIFLTQMLWYTYSFGYWGDYIQNRLMHLTTSLLICLSAGTLFSYIVTPITKRVNKHLKY